MGVLNDSMTSSCLPVIVIMFMSDRGTVFGVPGGRCLGSQGDGVWGTRGMGFGVQGGWYLGYWGTVFGVQGTVFGVPQVTWFGHKVYDCRTHREL